MLLAAREYDCQHIWNGPRRGCAGRRRAGCRGRRIRDGNDLPALTDLERAIINYAREFFADRKVGRGAFQDALEQLGKQGLIELTPGHRKLQFPGLRHQRL